MCQKPNKVYLVISWCDIVEAIYYNKEDAENDPHILEDKYDDYEVQEWEIN